MRYFCRTGRPEWSRQMPGNLEAGHRQAIPCWSKARLLWMLHICSEPVYGYWISGLSLAFATFWQLSASCSFFSNLKRDCNCHKGGVLDWSRIHAKKASLTSHVSALTKVWRRFKAKWLGANHPFLKMFWTWKMCRGSNDMRICLAKISCPHLLDPCPTGCRFVKTSGQGLMITCLGTLWREQ